MGDKCAVCGKYLRPPGKDGGRPRVYCGERCKGMAKRRAMTAADREALRAAQRVQPESGPVCHVCGAPATVGTPPLLCGGCSAGR